MTSVRPTQAQDRSVAIWLLVMCSIVFAMVVLGGVTRLTGSGLSMVEWRPIMGALPPLSADEWQETFEIYQQTPEFKNINPHFDVHDFKGIFWLEYLHRLLGRFMGIAFAIPFIYFAIKKYIPVPEWPKFLLMPALGGAQAFVGKIMVASGQVDLPQFEVRARLRLPDGRGLRCGQTVAYRPGRMPVDLPQVSQYRLTAHLLLAFLVFALMFWVALSRLFPRDENAAKHPWYGKTLGLFVLLTITITSGGFVAGLKAGKIYNTFPMMGEYWFPPGLFALEPLWRNFFDNIVTVQFDHRLLALTTFILVVVYWFRARRANLPARARPAVNALLHTAVLQVVLGIATLLLAVPVILGTAHQAIAMLLFGVALYLVHALRRV